MSDPFRFLVVFAALPLWFGAAPPAPASYVCPNGAGPGEVQVGVTGGSNGIAEMPVCEEDYDGGYDDEPAYDPMSQPVFSQGDWASVAADLAAEAADGRAKLESNPDYQAYKKGKWDFAKAGDARHRRCTAFFATLEGAIAIGGQKGDKEGTFLTFMGPGVPAPDGMRKVKVTLEQTGSAPQTVKAFNHRIDGGMGAITFTVPLDIASASDLFLDRQDFRVILKGKPVFDMGWHSGKTAQKKMRQCAG